MKTIRNLTRSPLRVPLGAGKVLHLGPGHTGEVNDASAERAAFVKLVEAGQIEFVDGGDGAEHGVDRESSSAGSNPGRAAKRTQRTGDR